MNDKVEPVAVPVTRAQIRMGFVRDAALARKYACDAGSVGWLWEEWLSVRRAWGWAVEEVDEQREALRAEEKL